MTDILNIGDEPVFDHHIVKIETYMYNPYANTTFEHSDEIRISIQQQDLYTLLYESFLYIERKLTLNKPAEGSDVTLGNNCIAFMFDEIQYKLDGVEIDRNRNVGITSTFMNYVTLSSDRITNGYFNFCVPLYMLLGFYEDYKRIMLTLVELILIQLCNDNNYLIENLALEPVINIFKIQWRMLHVILDKVNKLSMLRALESGRYLNMGFRSWDLYEFLLLQRTTKLSWAIKTAIQLEKSRYAEKSSNIGKRSAEENSNSVKRTNYYVPRDEIKSYKKSLDS
ncbi:hypothetical protein ACFW04_011704 [Cataglyphis niger]